MPKRKRSYSKSARFWKYCVTTEKNIEINGKIKKSLWDFANSNWKMV